MVAAQSTCHHFIYCYIGEEHCKCNFLGLLVQKVGFRKQSLEMVWEFFLRLEGRAQIIPRFPILCFLLHCVLQPLSPHRPLNFSVFLTTFSFRIPALMFCSNGTWLQTPPANLGKWWLSPSCACRRAHETLTSSRLTLVYSVQPQSNRTYTDACTLTQGPTRKLKKNTSVNQM